MKLDLSVKGMTCGGCEMHVEKAVLEIPGILSARADHRKSRLEVATDNSWSEEKEEDFLQEIANKIKDAGYEYDGLFTEGRGRNSDGFSTMQWIGILVILAALYLVVRETGIMNRLPVIESSMGYGLIFIIGLMTSVHCIGMCGGINLSVSVKGIKQSGVAMGPFKRATPALLYNAGRVVSYTAVGAVVGAAGSVISLSGAVQGIIVAVAGLFMIIMGVNMLGMFPRLAGLLPRLPRGLSSRIVNSGSGRGPFIVGILNGFMPCGPLQSIQIYALGTGSALSGAISMFLFSLGTVPLMLGFGSITSILPPRFHGRILKVSALLVLILGSGMILRGMSLNGISLPGTGNFDVNSENVRIAELGEEGRQYVRTTMKASEYEPLIVQAGIPVVWTIEAAQEDLNGCNNPLTIPEYNIRFTMSPGENTIEFTPPMKEGTITYTCWMGMITSGIKVVESLADIDPSQIDDAAALSGESSGGCAGSSCCSSGGAGTGGSFSSLKSFPEIPTDEIGIARMVEGIQIVEISISETGFSPAVIVMEKGVETKWLIEGVNLNDSTYRLTFPALGNRGIEISEGTNALGLFPESDFSFYTWQYDFGGYVNVVEDIDMVELDIVKSTVRSYNKGESSF